MMKVTLRLLGHNMMRRSTDILSSFFVIKLKWAATWQNQQSECAPSEDSDQPGHPPSLIRFFAVRMKKAWALSYPLSAQRRLWSDWADAQADLSLRWAHSHFVGFVMSRLIFKVSYDKQNLTLVVIHGQFYMKFIKLTKGSFNKFHMKWPFM